MGPTLLIVLLMILGVALLTAGIIFVRDGNKKDSNGKRSNIAFFVIGWVILGIVSLGATFATVYVIWEYASFILVILLFFSPLILLGGLVFTLAFGITNLIKGHATKKVSTTISGYVCLAVFITIIISIIILIIWFSNYLNDHPIRLM